MDSPQYYEKERFQDLVITSFKPYYKWIVLNTLQVGN